MELLLAAVFGSLFGPTGGPCVAMFRRFQQSWPNNDKTNYEVASDDMFNAHTSGLREEMVKFCKATLEGSHQRADYEEFLKFSLIFLGGEHGEQFPFGHQEHSIMHVGWQKPSMALKYLFSSGSSF